MAEKEPSLLNGEGSVPPKKEDFSVCLYQKEAAYLADILKEIPDFYESYQRVFLPGVMEQARRYYQEPPPETQAPIKIPPNVDLVRHLIYFLRVTATKEKPFISKPLPPKTFLVTSEKVAERVESWWQKSFRSYFSGYINPGFLPQRQGTLQKERQQSFLNDQKVLVSLYRRKDPTLAHLYKSHPCHLNCLEAYCFQGKTITQIAHEQEIDIVTARRYKEFALRAAGIKTELKGKLEAEYQSALAATKAKREPAPQLKTFLLYHLTSNPLPNSP